MIDGVTSLRRPTGTSLAAIISAPEIEINTPKKILRICVFHWNFSLITIILFLKSDKHTMVEYKMNRGTLKTILKPCRQQRGRVLRQKFLTY